MTEQPETSRHQEFSAVAQQMLALGESGRYEFKRDVDAVTVGLLAALANWVATDPTREVAHLLVGVDEVEDKTTGLVHRHPFGLPKGLDKAVSRIQDLASKTRPIPVEVFIVEEGVAEPTPFVRVEVRPTMPPHFDDQGRRQTRQGRSTRALTDEELLRIYLDREAGSFAMRFRQVSDELRSAVGAVGSQVDQIADRIEKNVATPITVLSRTTHDAEPHITRQRRGPVGVDGSVQHRDVRPVPADPGDISDSSPQIITFDQRSDTRQQRHLVSIQVRRYYGPLAAELHRGCERLQPVLRVQHRRRHHRQHLQHQFVKPRDRRIGSRLLEMRRQQLWRLIGVIKRRRQHVLPPRRVDCLAHRIHVRSSVSLRQARRHQVHKVYMHVCCWFE